MERYRHKVFYYETDRMGVTHHSNYIRWMEEARIDYLDKIGFNYAALEERGISSPILEVECKYKRSTTFDEEVEVRTWLKEYRGVKIVLGYRIVRIADGAVAAEGSSKNCFLNADRKPVLLRDAYPEFDEKLKELIEPDPV